jgi:hypothetical protein
MYNSRSRVFQDAQRARDEEEMLPSYVRGGAAPPPPPNYYEPPPQRQRRDDYQPPPRRYAAPPPPPAPVRRVRSRSPSPPQRHRQQQRPRLDPNYGEEEEERRRRPPRMNAEELDLAEQRMRNLQRVRGEDRPRRRDDHVVERRREASPVGRAVGRSTIDELPGMSLTSLLEGGPAPIVCSAAAPPRVADVIRQRVQQQKAKDPLLDIDDRFDVNLSAKRGGGGRSFEDEEVRRHREKMLEARRLELERSKEAFEAGKMHPRDVQQDHLAQEQHFMQHNSALNSRSQRQVEEDKRTHYADRYGLSMTELRELDAAVPVNRFQKCKEDLGGGSTLHTSVTHFLKEYKRQHEISYRDVAIDLYKAGIKYIWIQARGTIFYGHERDYLTVMRASSIRDALDKIEK